jgi:RNA polymerase sigma-70 factor (ECF subfamily)
MTHPDELAEHFDFARRLARRLVRDATARDDVLQDTWVAALEAAPRDPERLRGWLATLMRRLWSRQRRSGVRRIEHERRGARAEALPATDEVAAAMDVHRRVVEAVMDLPEAYRSAIVLRYFEDLSVGEIAARCDAPVETVRTRIKRGIERLRSALDQDGEERWLPSALVLARASRSRSTSTPKTSWSLRRRLVTLAAGAALAAGVVIVGLVGVLLRNADELYASYDDEEPAPEDAPTAPVSAVVLAAPARPSGQDEHSEAFSKALGARLADVGPLGLPGDDALAAVAAASDTERDELRRAELYAAMGPTGALLLALVPLETGDMALLALTEQNEYFGAAVLSDGLERRAEWSHFLEGFQFAGVPRLDGARPRTWLAAERERVEQAKDDPDAALVLALLDLQVYMNDQASVFNLPSEQGMANIESQLDMMADRYSRVAELAPDLRPLFGDAVDEIARLALDSAGRLGEMKAAFAGDDAERAFGIQRQVMGNCKGCHFMTADGFEGRLADASSRIRAELGVGNGFYQIGHDLRIRHPDREPSQAVADGLRVGALLIDATLGS